MIATFLLPVTASAAILLATAVAGALVWLWFSLRKELETLRDKMARTGDLAEQLKQLQNQLEQLQSQVAEVEQRRMPAADWSAEPASVNLNRRGQVIRLHRRGESSSQIASALGLSQGEVRLIVKVHELRRSAPQTEKSGERALIGRRIFDTDTRGRK